MFIDERPLQWVYPACATVALLIALLLPSAAKTMPVASRQTYWILQAITLVGAVIGAKIAMLAGDLGWPHTAISLDQVIFSGKSVVGGLLGGFIAAELAKRPLGYGQPPNDWFATKLVLSILIGRVGCLLAGCCRGAPASWGIGYSDGILRVPIPLFEIVFHAGLFGAFCLAYRRGLLQGRLFALYMIVYGVFRAVLEPWRDTPKFLGGFSVYQGLALCLIGAGIVSMKMRTREVAIHDQRSLHQ